MQRSATVVRPRTREPRLDKGAVLPLYQQLYGILRGQMSSGELEPGDLVPAESELMQIYGVSRITVRAALEQLVNEGLVERQRGRGSFVKAPPVADARACMVSFTDQTLAAGRTPSGRVVDVARGRAEELGLLASPFPADDALVRIDRLRAIDGVPAALMRTYLTERSVPGIGPDAFAEYGPKQSILYVLERRYGLALDQGEETIVPTTVAGRFADLLGLPGGSAVVMKTCLVRDVAGAPALYEESYWNAPQKQLLRRVATCA